MYLNMNSVKLTTIIAYAHFFSDAIDNEAPYYTNCPEDIVKTHDYSNPWGRMRITWGHPWFKDNSGEYPHVVASYANGHLFKIGQHQVSREIPCSYL